MAGTYIMPLAVMTREEAVDLLPDQRSHEVELTRWVVPALLGEPATAGVLDDLLEQVAGRPVGEIT